MKVLVTGGAGFIGSHVVDAYLEAGYQVVVVDNLATGSMSNLPAGVKFYLLDILSAELDKVFQIEKPEVVNHHAAQISVTLSARDPVLDARINALGLLNVLEASVRHKIKKFIFISTGGAIYGDTEQMPTPEDHPATPLSPYGIHKFLGENYLRFYGRQHGLGFTILRYANVYGPRQNPEGEAGVISIFIDRLLQGQTPTIYRYPEDQDGMTRDYVYVGDVARASVRAIDRCTGQAVNIGTEIQTSTGALYREIAALLNPGLEPLWDEPRPGDLRRSCLDISKAKKELAWSPETDLKTGLAKTVDFFKK